MDLMEKSLSTAGVFLVNYLKGALKQRKQSPSVDHIQNSFIIKSFYTNNNI